MQIGIYEGLAPALLHVLRLDSFTVDHAGKSTRGKTITVMGGLSCWADPSEKGDGLLSWQTTVIEAERRFNLVNGLPVVLDETRFVKDPGIVDTILYEVPKNHGKPRRRRLAEHDPVADDRPQHGGAARHVVHHPPGSQRPRAEHPAAPVRHRRREQPRGGGRDEARD